MNKKNIILIGVILSLVGSLTFITLQINKPKPAPFLVDLSNELNAFYPMKVDQITTLNKTYVEGNELIYDYTLDNEEFKLTSDAIKIILEDKVVNGICSHPESMAVMAKNASIIYDYSDTKKKHLLSLKVDSDTCKNLKK